MKVKNEFISGLSSKVQADPEMIKKVRFLQELILKDHQQKKNNLEIARRVSR